MTRPAPTRRELRFDVLLAAAVAVGALLSSVLYRIAGFFEQPAPGWAAIPLALGLAVPLIWRRRHPTIVVVVVGATFVGPGVAELLHAATVAVVGEVPIARLWHAVPAYPTVSEIWLRLLEAWRDGA